MRIFIHIGMIKTGSTSIQKTFMNLDSQDHHYLNIIESGNHSGIYVLLFDGAESVSSYHGFRERGSEFVRNIPEMRNRYRAKISALLSDTDAKAFVFSAETISLPRFKDAAHRMRDFFIKFSNDILLVGYVRAPNSLMSSTFQQRLRPGNLTNLLDSNASPRYRERFEHLDKAFGRDAVKLKEFAPHKFPNCDVVQDFAHEIGVGPLAEDQIIRANESLSLEAVALLYVQRKMGQGFVQGFDRAHAANNMFIAKLATIGRRKFVFSPQLLAPILEREREDIAWMEERLGHPFSESGAAHPDAIDSLDDLVDIALGQFDTVQDLLGENAVDGPATTETLVRALERLREQCYAQVVGAQQATHSLQQKGNARMATKTKRPEPTSEELRLRTSVGRLLWHTLDAENIPADPEKRRAVWDEVKHDYNKKATQFMRRLEKHNLMIVETDPQG